MSVVYGPEGMLLGPTLLTLRTVFEVKVWKPTCQCRRVDDVHTIVTLAACTG